ncbi:hypothetical protein ACUHMQ_13035 [Chitinimonas sp. PSY-7]|uniref:hypothetical protein n=1 Tax=Chitinimonas sp. PSY-7 TaxID=3459088 RepID=UPI00403FC8A1
MRFLLLLLCLSLNVRAQSVMPTSGPVPANLLRFYIRFTQPQSERVLPRLSLRSADGRLLEHPFLERELWSPNQQVLTVLLHPGRVKTGLVARQQLGPILNTGDEVDLLLDGEVLAHWHVEMEDRLGPEPADWRISTPKAGTKAPLFVRLDAPIDASANVLIAVADATGHRVEGRAQLLEDENIWSFTPKRTWQQARYRLMLHPELEDATGNRVGGSFESHGQIQDRPAPKLEFDIS